MKKAITLIVLIIATSKAFAQNKFAKDYDYFFTEIGEFRKDIGALLIYDYEKPTKVEILCVGKNYKFKQIGDETLKKTKKGISYSVIPLKVIETDEIVFIQLFKKDYYGGIRFFLDEWDAKQPVN
jgi:hypothetical protein